MCCEMLIKQRFIRKLMFGVGDHEKILNEIERKKILLKKIAFAFKPKIHSF